jgi:hypothetical protein
MVVLGLEEPPALDRCTRNILGADFRDGSKAPV